MRMKTLPGSIVCGTSVTWARRHGAQNAAARSAAASRAGLSRDLAGIPLRLVATANPVTIKNAAPQARGRFRPDHSESATGPGAGLRRPL